MMANPTANPKRDGETVNSSTKRRKFDLQHFREIGKYLTPDVTPVALPGRDEVEKENPYDIPATFPPLILDGASGIGKTQQAFALLKAGHKLVYLNLARGSYLQRIYIEMMDFTTMYGGGSIRHIDNALRELRANALAEEDPLSMESLGFYILQWQGRPETGEESQRFEKTSGFISWLRNRVLTHDPEGHGLLLGSEENLREVVLFVDEALPSPDSSEGSQETECPTDRLKFLRNLGRVLHMRVVLAGTGAATANVQTMRKTAPIKFSGPRSGVKQYTWAVVEFLYLLIPHDGINHRPLVCNWLARLAKLKEGSTMAEKIVELGFYVTGSKSNLASAENVFIWLSGAYLSTDGNPTSPFCQQPSALVRDHFFEPALATCEVYGPNDEKKIEIHDGKGFGKISRKIREPGTRLEILQYVNCYHHHWILRGDDLPPAFSFEYKFIEYALTNCVQVCLATEPLLALCISTSHQLSRKQLQAVISEALPETPIQRNRGALDAELNEQIMFAALQLSSNKDMSSPTKLEDFVRNLHDYLLPSYGGNREDGSYDKAMRFLKSKGIELTKKLKVQDRNISFRYHTDSAENLFKREAMPWLVPACDKDLLFRKIQEYTVNYFENFKMAGLVPGITNAPMDAEAFLWPTQEVTELVPNWAFEFKVRRSLYSPNEAMDDLNENLTVEELATHSVTGAMTYTKCPKSCHGMLIAITNSEKSLCEACIVEAGGFEYLRVIVLIGCSNLSYA